MTQDQIIASSTAIVSDVGSKVFSSIFGLFPTWALYAIPLAMVVGIFGYFLYRRGPGGGHR